MHCYHFLLLTYDTDQVLNGAVVGGVLAGLAGLGTLGRLAGVWVGWADGAGAAAARGGRER